MKKITTENLPSDPATWPVYTKVHHTPAILLEEDCEVETPEGVVQARAGDYLAVDSRGYPYPIQPDEFDRIYEEIGLPDIPKPPPIRVPPDDPPTPTEAQIGPLETPPDALDK